MCIRDRTWHESPLGNTIIPAGLVSEGRARNRFLRTQGSQSCSDDAAFGCPSGQLVAVRELKFAEHGGNVGLDRLDRYREAGGDLFVCVASCDLAEDLAFAWRQPVPVSYTHLRAHETVL